MKTVFLDTGCLGFVTHPRAKGEAQACAEWLANQLDAGTKVVIPEIADYELRRSYILTGSKGLERLDEMRQVVEYLPITTRAMRRAAECWAQARKDGMQTAGDKALDADMILVAQVAESGEHDCVVATVDVGDLSRFLCARRWQEIDV